jgi:putative transposase
MPGKNTIKELFEGGYYHVYNRGVAKQNIYRKRNDYVVFLRFLKEYLLPLDHPERIELQGLNPRRRSKTYYGEVELQAFCLMPNHFHLLIKNLSKDGLASFMQALGTNYSMYFNHEYERVGSVFQGTYKAVPIYNEAYYIWVSRYIHRNPIEIQHTRVSPLYEYPYSSYQAYLGKWHADWLNSDEIASRYSTTNPKCSYQNFVEEYSDLIPDLEPLFLGLDD